ncbi:hypothetical protein, partial [Streptomyces albus]|uniref:hypothetical protein n=1 Tax=Streptomyces albus TaxID=1888 RepID=UPI001B80D544
MIDVIAAMDGTDPHRCFQCSSARAIGSNDRLSGFGTPRPYRPVEAPQKPSHVPGVHRDTHRAHHTRQHDRQMRGQELRQRAARG